MLRNLTNYLKANKQFLHSTAALVGTMVGVGIFGIPFVFAKAGFWVGFGYLVFTAIITTVGYLTFAEMVLRTDGRHELSGYAEVYLGAWAKKVILVSLTLGVYGALLAYIIVAGDFLHNIFSHLVFWPTQAYSILFFIAGSLLVLVGLRAIAWVEFGLMLLYIGVILIVFGFGVPKIEIANFSGVNPAFWFLPYGVLLFAFGGLTAVPIQRDILRGKEKLLKKSILTAIILVASLYLLFAVTVVGVSGDVTSPDAVSGLFDFLGPRIIFLGSVFGILAVTTSFLLLGTALLDVFTWDYKVRRIWAWLLVVVPPLALYLSGLRNFIDIISLVGAVALGVEPIILMIAYRKAKKHGSRRPEFTIDVPVPVLALIGALFAAGTAYALIIR